MSGTGEGYSEADEAVRRAQNLASRWAGSSEADQRRRFFDEMVAAQGVAERLIPLATEPLKYPSGTGVNAKAPDSESSSDTAVVTPLAGTERSESRANGDLAVSGTLEAVHQGATWTPLRGAMSSSGWEEVVQLIDRSELPDLLDPDDQRMAAGIRALLIEVVGTTETPDKSVLAGPLRSLARWTGSWMRPRILRGRSSDPWQWSRRPPTYRPCVTCSTS